MRTTLPSPTPLAFPFPPSPAASVPFPTRAPHVNTTTTRVQCTSNTQQSSSSVEPKKGVAVYKPKSYEVLVSDAADALGYALQDGKTRLEIDFPPLPSSISSYKGSSDEFIDANIQLALAVVKKIKEKGYASARIVFPDKPEKRRASQLFKGAFDLIGGITIGSLDDIPSDGPVNSFFKSVRESLDFDFEDENEGRWESTEQPSIYIFINCSTRDLPVIEKKNLQPQRLPFYSILNSRHCVLIWVS